MELTYTQCGDYLIPNLVLSDTKEYHIGKYGRMRRAYLKEYRPALYPAAYRKTLSPFGGNRRRLQKPAGNHRDCHDAPGRRDRSTESRRSDGVGAPEEQHPQPSRRNRPA